MESNKKPLVSVIIPTYKRTVKYVSRAVESVINQTYPNVEIIVIDDSTSAFEQRTETEEYFRSLNASNVIYLQNEENLGGCLSRNRGIEQSTGEYITFLDDDDEYKPEKIEHQIEFIVDKGYDLIFSDLIIYSPDGRIIDYREHRNITSFENEALLHHHLTNHLTGTPTFMFKADKLKEIGGFDKVKVGQEFHLMLKSIQSGLKIGYLPICDVKVYRHPDGGISGGTNKIIGEKELFNVKKQFFPQLSKEEIRFITFRHHAVLTAGYKRNKMYGQMILSGIRTIISSPVDFVREVFKFVKKLQNHKN